MNLCEFPITAFVPSLHKRKIPGLQFHGPQLHYEEKDGALERGNGADRTVTAGQESHSLFITLHKALTHTEARACQIPLVCKCLYFQRNKQRLNHTTSGRSVSKLHLVS